MVQRILPLIRGIRVLKNWKRCMNDPLWLWLCNSVKSNRYLLSDLTFKGNTIVENQGVVSGKIALIYQWSCGIFQKLLTRTLFLCDPFRVVKKTRRNEL
jgi:hypothetical protein